MYQKPNNTTSLVQLAMSAVNKTLTTFAAERHAAVPLLQSADTLCTACLLQPHAVDQCDRQMDKWTLNHFTHPATHTVWGSGQCQ